MSFNTVDPSDQSDKYEVLFSEEEIQQRVSELAEEISKDYENDPDTPLVLICVLNGAVFFYSDLVKQIKHPNIICEFVSISSYGSGKESSREPKILLDTKNPLADKNVIVIEDIIDSGYSMGALLEILASKDPKSLKVCSLLVKDGRQEIEVPVGYAGFRIPRKLWVQGYGMDTGEEGRTLPFIIVID